MQAEEQEAIINASW